MTGFLRCKWTVTFLFLWTILLCDGAMYFPCNDGRLLHSYHVCDHYPDCANGEDERDCFFSYSYNRFETYLKPTLAPTTIKPARAHFICLSGLKISIELRCDGYLHCDDGSDEKFCPADRTDFVCLNGLEISNEFRCDGYRHCDDGSDEMFCPEQSTAEMVTTDLPTTASRDYECLGGNIVSVKYLCDGVLNCDDGSDEMFCPDNVPHTFSCDYRKWIHNALICNGEYNCEDKTDEFDCDVIKCLPGKFLCEKWGRCISDKFVCDGTTQCKFGSDEENCNRSQNVCPENKFLCNNWECISEELHCDGKEDCMDGTDEKDCQKQADCPDGFFKCSDMICRPDRWRCDGVVDCPNGLDEDSCHYFLKNDTIPS